MSTNRLSVEITQEKSDAVDQLMSDLLVELDFLVSLSIAGKKRLAKMGRKNLDFVNRSFRHAGGSTQFLPSFLTVEEFKKDVDLAVWLRKFEKQLDMLADRVKDTAILAEAEAFRAARYYYSAVKAAARVGSAEAEPIVKDLGLHFKRQGISTGEESSEPDLPVSPDPVSV
jgi:hypothetical protein